MSGENVVTVNHPGKINIQTFAWHTESALRPKWKLDTFN